MKKTVIFVLTAFIVLCVCSCHNNESSNETTTEYLKYIYEIDEDLYGSETELFEFNHSNLISGKPIYSVSGSVLATKKMQIINTEVNLTYKETLFYPLHGEKVNKYIVNGKEENCILLNEDGSVNAILFSFTTLEISKTASPEHVRVLLEPVIANLIDISQYQYIDLPKYDEDTEAFGIYSFLYYNMVDGYITDYAKVSVSENGEVFGLSENNLAVDNIDLNISKDLEDKLLSLKLSDIYTTSETEYKSYNTVFPPQVVLYNNELHVQYSVSAIYTHSLYGEMHGWATRILIPVQQITANNTISGE